MIPFETILFAGLGAIISVVATVAVVFGKSFKIRITAKSLEIEAHRRLAKAVLESAPAIDKARADQLAQLIEAGNVKVSTDDKQNIVLTVESKSVQNAPPKEDQPH